MQQIDMNVSSKESSQLAKWGVLPIVNAAVCIASNNTLPGGQQMYDVSKAFGGWVREHVEKRLKEKAGK